MRRAYEHGFGVVTLTDSMATLSQEAQDMALTQNGAFT
jgi:nicotinamidase-related amidase